MVKITLMLFYVDKMFQSKDLFKYQDSAEMFKFV